MIVLLPGPNSLYVLSVAARRGVRTNYVAAAGVWTGSTVLMTLSALGAASLLQTTPPLFAHVKYADTGYLTWLAIGLLRAAVSMWRNRHQRVAEPAGCRRSAAGISSSARASPSPSPR